MKKTKQGKLLTSIATLSLIFLLLAGLFIPVYAQEISSTSSDNTIVLEDSTVDSSSEETIVNSESPLSEVPQEVSESKEKAESDSVVSSSSISESDSSLSEEIGISRFALLLDGIMPYAEDLVNSKTLTGIHFKLSNGYEDTAHWRKAIYGLNAYCVEPGVNALGTSYTVKGILMDKSINKALLIDGKEVTGSTTFVADKTDGTVDILFTFDSTLLNGKEIVVFESLYYSYREIATHADITDVGQTIKFTAPPTPPYTPVKTGDNTNLVLPIVLLIVGLCAGAVLIFKSIKHKQLANSSDDENADISNEE